MRKLILRLKLYFKKIDSAKENQKLLYNIVGTIGIKGIAMCLTLFTMPAYMSYFQNNAVLGVWFSLVAILNWILTFDLGIGNGLRNQLVPYLNKNDKKEVKYLISSSYFFLGIVSVGILIIGSILITCIDLNKLLNISKEIISSKTLIASVWIVFAGVVLRFFLQIIISIFYAMQRTVLPNVLTLISSILILMFVFIYKNDSVCNRLLALSVAQTVTLCLPLLIATIVAFCTELYDERPSFKNIDWNRGKKVISLGGKFFMVQICLLLISSTNDVLISNLTTPESTVEFQVYNRIFYTIITLFSLLTQPMWSAFSQANATNNFYWIKKIYNKFNLLALMGTIFSFGIAFIFEFIVNIWLGENSILIHLSYSICFAVLIGINLFINSSTCVANGLNELKCQMVGSVIGAVLKIPLSVLFVKAVNSWIGVILSNIVVLLPLLFMQLYDSTHQLNIKISAMQKE